MASSSEARRAGPDTVAVIVPAHNEARLIPRCLASLRVAADRMHATLPDAPAVRLLAVLDSCTDRTAEAVAAESGVQVIVVQQRRVGSARRAGAEQALTTAGIGRCWLASTDADTTVPTHWLTRMVDLARSGADMVLGTVEPSNGLPAEVRRRWRVGYHDIEGHPHVHGANLGISAAAYTAIGGWPPTARDEDVLLVRRAEAAGLRIVRTGSLAVRPSSRLAGRAPSGFASHLAALTREVGAQAG
jgi:glycosyltransferase involved in cell wall biosynthesis